MSATTLKAVLDQLSFANNVACETDGFYRHMAAMEIFQRLAGQYIEENAAALKRFELELAARSKSEAPEHAGICWEPGNAAPEWDQPYARTASCGISFVIVGRDWRPE